MVVFGRVWVIRWIHDAMLLSVEVKRVLYDVPWNRSSGLSFGKMLRVFIVGDIDTGLHGYPSTTASLPVIAPVILSTSRSPGTAFHNPLPSSKARKRDAFDDFRPRHCA
jgi:hypothetical protein